MRADVNTKVIIREAQGMRFTAELIDISVTGFRVRLLETAGRPAALTLSAFKPISLAERVDFLGKRLDQCQVLDGKTKLDLAAHEFVEVVGRW